MKAERKIEKQLLTLMSRRGLSYRFIGERMGCSAQNVWNRLNDKRVSPEFRVARSILMAMGMDFRFEWNGKEISEGTRNNITRAAEQSRVIFITLWDLLDAVEIRITIEALHKGGGEKV